MLRQLDGNLWLLDKPFRMFGAELGGRMTVAKLRDGSLLAVSPVRTTPEDRAALDRIGPLRHIIAPNRMHYLFVAELKSCYPEAKVYVAPGLPDKARDLRYDEVLGEEPPAALAQDLVQTVVGGMPGLNEVALLVKPSRTLILTDLLFNITRSEHAWTRFFFTLNGGYGKLAATRVLRTLIKDPKMTRAGIDRVLAWDFDRLIVTHGEVVERDARAGVREAFSFLR